jgi:uncharacterized membrane protein YphA (DoxX/SURF4 family)
MKHALPGKGYFNNLFTTGKYMYLIGLAELAVYNFFKEDFAMTRPPALPDWLKQINPVMAYSTGILLLLCIVAVIWNKYTSQALVVISVIFFLCATIRHASVAWKDAINGLKTLWLIGGALLILSTVGHYKKYQQPILFANMIILFMFFYQCAVAHFGFAEFVKDLIPTFIPFRLFFTYFAGVCLLLAGIGLLIPKFQKLAALLSGIQITGWFLLLHLPRAFTIGGDDWIGVGESLAVAGICFMLYGIFRQERLTIPEWVTGN